TGVLVSRIMHDTDGIRNLLGTGLAQFGGGLVTAALALVLLFYVNWQITTVSLTVLALFAAIAAVGVRRLRPLFRERRPLNAEVVGGLAESLGGIRIVKAYTGESRQDRVFARGIHRLLRNVARAMTAVAAGTALGQLVAGIIAAIILIMGGRAILDHR